MRSFRSSMHRFGPPIFVIAMLLFIAGFHQLPALWIPLVAVFVVMWIMGVRSDRKAATPRRKRRRP